MREDVSAVQTAAVKTMGKLLLIDHGTVIFN